MITVHLGSCLFVGAADASSDFEGLFLLQLPEKCIILAVQLATPR